MPSSSPSSSSSKIQQQDQSLTNTPPPPLPTILEGVLLKRRDVFTKKWRPRLFVLHIPSSLLVYYLLNEEQQQQQQQQQQQKRKSTLKKRFGGGGGGNKTGNKMLLLGKKMKRSRPTLLSIGGGSSYNVTNDEDEDASILCDDGSITNTSTPKEEESATAAERIKYLEFSDSDHCDANNNNNNNNNTPKNIPELHNDLVIQTTNTNTNNSNSSLVDKNPIDYDVVPRGSISLSNRTISINGALSTNELFVFTIHAPAQKSKDKIGMSGGGGGDGGTIYLAASSEAERNSWMYYLDLACHCPMSRHADDHSSISTKEEVEGEGEEEEIVFQNSSSLFPLEEQQTMEKSGGDGMKRSSSVNFAPLRQDDDDDDDGDNGKEDTMVKKEDKEEVNDKEIAVSNETIPNEKNGKNEEKHKIAATPTIYQHIPPTEDEIITSKLNSTFGSYIHHLLLPTTTTAATTTPHYRDQKEEEWVNVTNNMLVLQDASKNTSNVTDTEIYQYVFDKKDGKIMMKMSSVFRNIDMLKVFELLVDPGNRTIYDASIQASIRLKQYNKQTFLDYYSCHAILPSAEPNDFLVISHWRVISLPSSSSSSSSSHCYGNNNNNNDENNDSDDDKDGINENGVDKHKHEDDDDSHDIDDSNNNNQHAIVFFSFSHVNNEICPPIQDHVRGDLIVSMYLLEPISEMKNNNNNSGNGCKLTRILCMNLNDSNNDDDNVEKVVSESSTSSVGKVIMQKQSVLPFAISDYFSNEGDGPKGGEQQQQQQQQQCDVDKLKNKITNEYIIDTIISKISWEDTSEDVSSEDVTPTEPITTVKEEKEKEEQMKGNVNTDDGELSKVDSSTASSDGGGGGSPQTHTAEPLTQKDASSSSSSSSSSSTPPEVERGRLVADRSARGLIENYTDTVVNAITPSTDANSKQPNTGSWANSIRNFVKTMHVRVSSSSLSKRQKRSAIVAAPFLAYFIYIMAGGVGSGDGGSDVVIGAGYNLYQSLMVFTMELMSLLSTSNIIYIGESLVTMLFLTLFIAVALKSGVDKLNKNTPSSPTKSSQRKNKKEKQSRLVEENVKSASRRGSSGGGGGGGFGRSSIIMTVFHTFLCFLIPIISWELEERYYFPWKGLLLWKGVLSAISTLFVIRALVMRQLGPAVTNAEDGMPISSSISHMGTGAVTCRFKVNLKGILRFIANKKEEKEEQMRVDKAVTSSSLKHRSSVEVSVTHIVVKAVACAMADLPVLNSHHIYYLPLLINGFFTSDTIDISVASGASSQRSNHIVTLRDVEGMSIQQIAELVARRKKRNDNKNVAGSIWSMISMVGRSIMSWMPLSGKRYKSQFGSCIVFTSPDSENSEVDIEVSPAPHAGGANIAVVVGGVRRAPRSSPSSPRHPFLSVSITIDCPAASVGTCRKFVEHVQSLLQFPEIYEEGQSRS